MRGEDNGNRQGFEIETYVIDVLQAEVAECLREVLGEPILENARIVKLLHGCQHSDLQWMVRDFGIKLACVFDTQEFQRKFIASNKLSLANFWDQYCPGMAQIELDQKKEL